MSEKENPPNGQAPQEIGSITIKFLEGGGQAVTATGHVQPGQAVNFLEIIKSMYVDVQKAAMLQDKVRQEQLRQRVVGADGMPFFGGG